MTPKLKRFEEKVKKVENDLNSEAEEVGGEGEGGEGEEGKEEGTSLDL